MIAKIVKMFDREQLSARLNSDGKLVLDANGNKVKEYTLAGKKRWELIIDFPIAYTWLSNLAKDGEYLSSLTHNSNSKLPYSNLKYCKDNFMIWNRCYKVWKRVSPYYTSGKRGFVKELVATMEAMRSAPADNKDFKLLCISEDTQAIEVCNVPNATFFDGLTFVGAVINEGEPTEQWCFTYYHSDFVVHQADGSFLVLSQPLSGCCKFVKEMLLYKCLHDTETKYNSIRYFSSPTAFLKR